MDPFAEVLVVLNAEPIGRVLNAGILVLVNCAKDVHAKGEICNTNDW